MKYSFKTEVRGYELDSYGHVNNAVYINYTEQARWEILKKAGLLESFLERNLLLVVTETKIRYMRELKLFNKVEIITTVKFEAPYLVFYQDINNETDSLKSAKAIVKTLLIDKDKIPQDIPEELMLLVKK
jgi:acyl-CoA thioester hydrolase